VRLVNLDIRRITDLWPALRAIAAEMGGGEEGVRISMQIQHRMAAILRQATDCSQRPRAACIAQLAPLELAGGFVAELVEMAGGKYVPVSTKAKPVEADWAALHAADPDIILVILTGKGKLQARQAIEAFHTHDEWAALRAVSEGEVALCDAVPLFNRIGPRVVDALEIIAEIVQPNEFQFGHRGQTWEQL